MATEPKRKSSEFDIIEPIGKRVVVRKDDNKRETKSGIVLPDSHEIPVITGRVIAISKAIENDDDQTIRQYDKVLFIVEPSETAQAAIGKRVTVVDYPDGRIAIRYRGEELAYRTFDKIRQVNQAAIVDNKRLGGLLEMIKAYQETQPPPKRTSKAPKRRDQTGHMFGVG